MKTLCLLIGITTVLVSYGQYPGPIQKNGKWGFKDRDTMLLEAEFDTIYKMSYKDKDKFVVRKGCELAIVKYDRRENTLGKLELIPVSSVNTYYGASNKSHENRAYTQEGKIYTHIGGQWEISEPETDRLICATDCSGKTGLIYKGEQKVPFQHQQIISYEGKLFRALDNDDITFYDQEGKLICKTDRKHFFIVSDRQNIFKVVGDNGFRIIAQDKAFNLPEMNYFRPHNYGLSNNRRYTVKYPTYFPVWKGDKIGLMNRTGEMATEYIFDFIDARPGDVILTKQGDTYTFYNQDLKAVHTCVYDDFIGADRRQFYFIHEGKMIGINAETFAPEAELNMFADVTSVSPIYHPPGRVVLESAESLQSGYVDSTGTILIPFVYDGGGIWYGAVQMEDYEKGEEYIYFNQDGSPVDLQGGQLFGTMTEHAFLLGRKGKYALISTNNTYDIPYSEFRGDPEIFNWDEKSYAEVKDYYVLKRNGKYGLVDNRNKTIMEFKYDELYYDNGEDGSFLDVLVYKEGNEFVIADKGLKEVGRIQADRFVNYSYDGLVFEKDKEGYAYDRVTLEPLVNFDEMPNFNYDGKKVKIGVHYFEDY